MRADSISQYQSLFFNHKINDQLAKFICYIWSLIVAYIYEESPGQFYDYSSALSSNRAAPLIAYVNERPIQLSAAVPV